jgi:hypothetical protein
MLATMFQLRFAQLDENGLLASTVKDQVHAAHCKKKQYENKIQEYSVDLYWL